MYQELQRELMQEVLQDLTEAFDRAQSGNATPADWALIKHQLGLPALTERK